jgi:hypothetical protein
VGVGVGSRRDLGFLGKPASRLRVRTFAVELVIGNRDLGGKDG